MINKRQKYRFWSKVQLILIRREKYKINRKKCELYIWVAQYENVSKKIVYTEGVAAVDAIIL